MDQSLSVTLAKENFSNSDSPIVLTGDNSTPIFDMFQIKVNVKGTGFFISNFYKTDMNEEIKNQIFEKLKQLRGDGPVTDDSQKEKIRHMLEILNKYKPVFISFVSTGTPILTKSEFNDLINKEAFETTLLVLMLPFDYILPPSSGEQKKSAFSFFKKKENNSPKVSEPSKEETSEDIPQNSEDSFFKKQFIRIKKFGYDYLFMLLFSLIMSASFLFGLSLAFKGDASSVFLFVISVIFLGILGYALYSHQKSVKNWNYSVDNISLPILSIILGLVIGISVGFAIAYFVIKGTEENPLDYGRIVLISSLVTIGMALISTSIPIIVRLIQKKANKKAV